MNEEKNGLKVLKSLPFLYQVINKYEKVFKDYKFNKAFLSPDHVLAMIERLGVIIVEDRTFKAPFLMIGEKKKKLLVYNSHHQHDELVLQLGHELGHIICGHYELKLNNNGYDPILGQRIEREADIVGYLCFIPTIEIEKRLMFFSSMEYAYESLFQKIKTCDLEFFKLKEMLDARFRIFRAYQKVVLSFFADNKI